jgi:hypothetical protein
MAVIAALQGNGSGEGFLVAPVGARTFPAALSLQTDTGTADVTLRAATDAAGLVFSRRHARLPPRRHRWRCMRPQRACRGGTPRSR